MSDNKLIKQRKLRWLGHTLKGNGDLTNQVLTWNLQGKRKSGRPRTTWRKGLQSELIDKKIKNVPNPRKIGELLCVTYVLMRT